MQCPKARDKLYFPLTFKTRISRSAPGSLLEMSCSTSVQQHGLKRLHSLTVESWGLSALILQRSRLSVSTVSSTNCKDLSPNKGCIGTPLRKQRPTVQYQAGSQPHFNRRYRLRAHGVSMVPHRSSNDVLLRHLHFSAASYTRDHGETILTPRDS
jgi:hypothetical protein